jgi:hypothetical protein
LKYKKEMAIISGLFVIALFVGVNMMTSTSYPGISGGDNPCWECHNTPVYARTFAFNADLGSWPSGSAAWPSGEYMTQYVFTMSTDDPHNEPIDHVNVQFVTNDTHIMIKVRVTDVSATWGASSVSSDKVAILWNIDAYGETADEQFAMQQFTEEGAMKTQNGTLDMWYVDTGDFTVNSTGMANDMYIGTSGKSADSEASDVSVGIHYGVLRPGVSGYFYMFARELNTTNANDIQFEFGQRYQFGLAHWNNSAGVNHWSSYDQNIVIGNSETIDPDHYQVDTLKYTETETEINTVTDSVTDTVTETTTAAATGADGFTIVFVMVGLLVAIPIVARRRK